MHVCEYVCVYSSGCVCICLSVSRVCFSVKSNSGQLPRLLLASFIRKSYQVLEAHHKGDT